MRVAIVGPPNVGKSSLLNVLAAREAAIVSATPGTTRDAIEVAVELAGYKVCVLCYCSKNQWHQQAGAEVTACRSRWWTRPG